jgi:hypothetical protein
MGSKFLGLIVFLMLLFIFVYEVINLTIFIVNYHNIKELSKLSKTGCKNIYTESDTYRFQLSKNMYSLLFKNDIYNCQLYQILILVYAVIFYIYTSIVCVNYLFENQYPFKFIELFIIIIALYFLIMIIVNIIFRYVPYDEKGYINYFKILNNYELKTDDFNKSIFNILIFIFIGYFILNVIVNYFYNDDEQSENVSLVISSVTYMFYMFYYIFALHFLFNSINIVETFKNNTVPYDIYQGEDEKNWSADISYNSENYFYYQYLNLQNIPDFLNDINILDRNLNYAYKVHPIFISRFNNYILILFVVLTILIGLMFVANLIVYLAGYFMSKHDIFESCLNQTIKVFQKLYPLIFLFLLLLFLSNETTLNTSFNKNLLLDINAVYKYDLNKLNNVVTPYISMFNSYTSLNKQTNYLYNYIIINVLMSYLLNYINIFDNTPNTLTREYMSYIYKDLQYFEDTKKLFSRIELNDINNKDLLKTYYIDLFTKLFMLKDGKIPSLLVGEIDEIYIKNRLSKIISPLLQLDTKPIENESTKYMVISEEKFREGDVTERDTYKYFNKLNLEEIHSSASMDIKVKVSSTFKNSKQETKNIFFKYIEGNNLDIKFIEDTADKKYASDLTELLKTQMRNNIKYNMYKLFEILNMDTFNMNLEKVNMKDDENRKLIFNHLSFLVDADYEIYDNKAIPYKFILHTPFKKEDISLDKYILYDKIYNTKIENIINIFIEHIFSISKDLLVYLHSSQTGEKKSKIFYEQITQSIYLLMDTQNQKELYKSDLYYLYYSILKNFAEPIDSNDNYLQNIIENNYYVENEKNMDVVSMKTTEFNINEKDNLHHSRSFYDTEDTNESNQHLEYNTALNDIECKAYNTLHKDMTFRYILNLIIIYVVYSLIKSNN